MTIYWAPGEAGDCEAELRGFVIFLLVGVVVGGVLLEWNYSALSGAVGTLKSILTSGT